MFYHSRTINLEAVRRHIYRRAFLVAISSSSSSRIVIMTRVTASTLAVSTRRDYSCSLSLFSSKNNSSSSNNNNNNSQTNEDTLDIKALIHTAQTRDTTAHLLADRDILWHPYTSLTRHTPPTPVLAVASAAGCRLSLEGDDSTTLVDGMASWWSVIHGYRNPRLNAALQRQVDAHMSHVMFGGLTHRPAVTLGELLVALSPDGLTKVFLADSGSVSVEVALKMALQYHRGRNKRHNDKTKFVALQSGYHGDTMGAMSVCDPVNGMHSAFADNLMSNIFLPRPPCDERYSLSASSTCHGCTCHKNRVKDKPPTYQQALEESIRTMQETLATRADSIAAVICEPLVQGAGGMRFYDTKYLQALRAACTEHDILLICDEIATGFGRSSGRHGALFASQEAAISPDILCVGKALTAGYMTLAACLATEQVAEGVSAQPARDQPALPLMHGPTFMGNPLACSVAIESLAMCMETSSSSSAHDDNNGDGSSTGQPFFQKATSRIEAHLRQVLQPATQLDTVNDVRVRGGIGVIERKTPIDMAAVQAVCRAHGAWLRPFGRLVYCMPPYVATNEELDTIAETMIALAKLE